MQGARARARHACGHVGSLALQTMIAEKGIDLFINAENKIPTQKIKRPSVGAI